MTETGAMGVLWDMDGTIVDTEEYWMASETELVARYGKTWTHEDAVGLVGNSLDVSARILRKAGVRLSDEQIISELSKMVKRRVGEGLPWRQGVPEMLRALHDADIPMALVTMSHSLNAHDISERAARELRFEPFAAIVSGDLVEHGKPAPEPYLLAARMLGIPINRCVVFEDSMVGLTSGVASGALTIGVPNLQRLPQDAGFVIWPTLAGRTPSDVRRLLEERDRA